LVEGYDATRVAAKLFFTLLHRAGLGEDESTRPRDLQFVPAKLKLAAGKTLSPAAAKLRLLKRLHCTMKFEKLAGQSGARLIAGVDEVGRGSLFGPVVAAAVILDPDYRIRGLRDSKLLPAERRELLAERIREHAIAWAIAAVDAARIDQINIYQASRVAMREAAMSLAPAADHLLIDAMRLDCDLPQRAIIHGDALSASIAAASILAKVERDRMVREWDPVFPVYGLASNKGYSTPHHLAALREHGPSPLHRQSFAPVWNNPVPQEVLAFMLEEKPEQVLDEIREAAL
jgi:ribonuclease HII